MRWHVPLLLLLLLVAPLSAGEEVDVEELAHDYVSDDPAERRSAEAAIAEASPEVLREVLAHLRSCEVDGEEEEEAIDPAAASTKDLVSVEVWLVDAELGAARRLRLVDDQGRVATRTLAPEEAGLMGEAMGSPGVERVTAPRLTVYDRQRAHISVAENTSYVKDLEVRVAPDGSRIADPVIGTLVTGANLELTPRILEDRSEVLLDLAFELSDLVRPMAEHSRKVGEANVSLQLPEVRTQRMQKRVPVPVGRTVVVGGWSRSTQDATGRTQADRRLVLLLKAEVVASAEVEIDFTGRGGPEGARPPAPPAPVPPPPPAPPQPR